MAARKRALLAFLACARAVSARCSPTANAAMAVVPRSQSPQSGAAVVAEAVRGFGPLHYGAFAGLTAFAGVSVYMLCVPTSRKVLIDESDGNSSEESSDCSANGIAQNISSFIISAFFKDMHAGFRGSSSRDFNNLTNALRQHAYELRKSRHAEYVKKKIEQAAKEKEPEKNWITRLHEAVELFTTYFYLPEAIGDISAYLFTFFGGSVIATGTYVGTTSSHLFDPSICFECPFSGCLSLLPIYDEMSSSSSDPNDSNDTGDAGDLNGTTEIKIMQVPLEEFLSYDSHMFTTSAARIKCCGSFNNNVPVTALPVQKQLRSQCFAINMFPFRGGWIALLEQVPFAALPQSTKILWSS